MYLLFHLFNKKVFLLCFLLEGFQSLIVFFQNQLIIHIFFIDQVIFLGYFFNDCKVLILFVEIIGLKLLVFFENLIDALDIIFFHLFNFNELTFFFHHIERLTNIYVLKTFLCTNIYHHFFYERIQFKELKFFDE